jgi:anti-sigma regulatory factor (Ser/Thr protein kinase)
VLATPAALLAVQSRAASPGSPGNRINAGQRTLRDKRFEQYRGGKALGYHWAKRNGAAIRLERSFPSDQHAPTLARRALSGQFGILSPEQANDLELIVSELVTNAVRHSRGGPDSSVKLSVERSNESLRVQVTDEGNGFTLAPRPDPWEGGGFGLFLVESLASNWGIESGPGTTVWAEVLLPPPSD